MLKAPIHAKKRGTLKTFNLAPLVNRGAAMSATPIVVYDSHLSMDSKRRQCI